ncbi:testis-specific serine/threonine-protein kinase 3-like [Paramacrobiotus metropolitanus]|uniref:testis-specific serine/threonine-protein kinase 3-like n=1 Tax=Paramacrobiotus metropolitanus TaxID=2943436 RepID=UPI0024456C96|nr:testis-specific serine/threonine-protein kinase 3-like [Paramacrobiotus metropolitanus]
MPQLPLKVKPAWLSSLQPNRDKDPPLLAASPQSSPHPKQNSPLPGKTSQPAIRATTPGLPATRTTKTQPALVKNVVANAKCLGPHTNTANGRLSPFSSLDRAATGSPGTNHPSAGNENEKNQMSARDMSTMPRAVKVSDNVRSIIPAHKGIELTYDQRILGSFGIDVREKIGEGVYAKVRLGVDLFSGKPESLSKFAVKIIDKEKVTSRFIENFLDRELAVWSKLTHPGITQFYYYTVTPRKVYMVLEYMNGGDLLTYVQNLKSLPEKQQVVCWAWQLVNAIEYIHALGAAHRDIKLENILMDDTRSVLKLTDFGFSTDDAARLSTTFCGSKAYAAPELIRAVPYSPQAVDVWALGCVFFVFVNGIMAFDETVEQSVLLYNQRNRVYVWRNPRNHSSAAKRIIENMLTCDWKLRPTTSQLRTDPWIRSGAIPLRN